MPRPRRTTRKSQVKPLGVSERLGDAPPTHYVHGATCSTRPGGSDTYVLDGTEHRWDGFCHPECENVR